MKGKYTPQQKKDVSVIMRRIKKYNPEKVVLFGSYAWGTPGRSSDIDLLIIKRSQKTKSERITEVERLLYPAPQAVDVLVYTPQEMRKRLKLGDFFLTRIMDEGTIMYEKKS